jgi:predicted O-methyltransferase YrrM
MNHMWDAVDAYLEATLGLHDPVLAAGVERAHAAGIPAIQVTATQGKLLSLLARLVNARRILEIGTLAGFSATWLARALPSDGQLVTLEIEPRHAAVAAANLEAAGLADRVDIRLGAALDSLTTLAAEGGAPFDLVFIDADKRSNAEYVRRALPLTRSGALIVVDNVVREGSVLDTGDAPDIVGTREVLALLGSDPRLDATAIQTVGNKGYDGFAIAMVAL